MHCVQRTFSRCVSDLPAIMRLRNKMIEEGEQKMIEEGKQNIIEEGEQKKGGQGEPEPKRRRLDD